jgi:hypothetical protein
MLADFFFVMVDTLDWKQAAEKDSKQAVYSSISAPLL